MEDPRYSVLCPVAQLAVQRHQSYWTQEQECIDLKEQAHRPAAMAVYINDSADDGNYD